VAERAVGRELALLPAPWVVLHSLPVEGASGHLDHVAVGPTGVFAITTLFAGCDRAWVADDYVLVRNTRLPFARRAIAAARRTGQLAGAAIPPDISVRPVLAISGARRVRLGVRSRSVDVRHASDLRSFLEALPVVLDEVCVGRIASDIAEAVDAGSDGHQHMELEEATARFDRLERDVGAAHRIRTLWRVTGGLASSAAIWFSFAQLPGWLAGQLG
jgi:hypothetical protein